MPTPTPIYDPFLSGTQVTLQPTPFYVAPTGDHSGTVEVSFFVGVTPVPYTGGFL